jgi:hypothetical protein
MNKSLSVERLYSLGDYKNIKFSDTITDIPGHVALDQDVMKLLSYLQIVDIELSFNRYKELVTRAGTEKSEDILAFLEEERTLTFQNLVDRLADKHGYGDSAKAVVLKTPE